MRPALILPALVSICLLSSPPVLACKKVAGQNAPTPTFSSVVTVDHSASGSRYATVWVADVGARLGERIQVLSPKTTCGVDMTPGTLWFLSGRREGSGVYTDGSYGTHQVGKGSSLSVPTGPLPGNGVWPTHASCAPWDGSALRMDPAPGFSVALYAASLPSGRTSVNPNMLSVRWCISKDAASCRNLSGWIDRTGKETLRYHFVDLSGIIFEGNARLNKVSAPVELCG